MADLDRVGPYTIAWLNEAQFYLAPQDAALGERIAAGLRTLLHDPRRGPVLVLATLWPRYWDELTSRPAAGAVDAYTQARDLLTGSMVSVADGFTPGELVALRDTGVDPRLRQAAAHAEGGRITQYLAGAPELEDRYRTAPPAARAILQVAMDARRLGHSPALPHALLAQAAPGFLDDHDWDSLGEDWLEQALAYTVRPRKGARGPLTRLRPRPGDQNSDSEQPCYRLADYLEQIGRHERGAVYPPDSLWRAFATTATDPVQLRNLGQRAQRRGRYQHAIWLYTRAADLGDTEALLALAGLREQAWDTVGAEALYRQAADRGDTDALPQLVRLRVQAGDTAGAETLAVQAASHGNTTALRVLVRLREEAGDTSGAEAVAVQAADRGDTAALRNLAWTREQAWDTVGAEALYRQAADRGDTEALRQLVTLRQRAGDTAGAEALAVQAADRGDTAALFDLAILRERAGDTAAAEAFYQQAGDRGDTFALQQLAWLRERAGDTASAEAPAVQAADTIALHQMMTLREQAGDTAGAHVLAVQAANLGDTFGLLRLALLRNSAGDTAGAEALLRQAMDCGDPDALHLLMRQREQAGDTDGAETLAVQAANRGDTTALRGLAELREQAGDTARADQMRRFGLTGSGDVATALDFGS